MEKTNFIEKYERIEEEFNKFIKDKYDFRKPKIKHKFEHTHRVVEKAESIAKDMRLSEEDVFLAKVIALFHDLGRFEQIMEYDSFVDHKTMDHGAYGVKLLFEDGLIREYLEETVYDIIIREAVYNHNKYEIETQRLSEKELLHVKIIRDADKTDSFYLKAELDSLKYADFTKEELEQSLISEKVYEDFMDEKTILYEDVETPADVWFATIAFVFGYYYTSGLKVLKIEDYIEKIKNKVEFKNEETIAKVKNMFILVENYINYRIINDINF